MAKRLRYIGAGIPGGGQWGARKSRRGAGGASPARLEGGGLCAAPLANYRRRLASGCAASRRAASVWSTAGDHRDADSHRPVLVRCAPRRSRRFSSGGFAGGLRPHGRLRRHRFAAGLRNPTGSLRSICYGRLSPRRHSNKVWPPSSRRPDPRGDWRSVQVRFEFVNPEHLALNSGSGSLQPPVEILWRAYCRADLGPPDRWRTRRGVQGRPRPVLRLPRRRTRRATLRARGPR